MSSQLHKAFISLGLEPGASKDEVVDAYKLLVSGLHPDKHKGKKKAQAEKKLKQINNARELLMEHFKSGHTDSPGCDCKPSTQQQTADENSSDKESAKQSRAEKARQRNQERKEAESYETASDPIHQEPKDSNKTDSGVFPDEFTHSYDIQKAKQKAVILWKVTFGIFVFFVGCFFYANMTKGVHSTNGLSGKILSDKEKQVYADWSKYQQEKIDVVYKITGTKVSKKSALNWRPPFEPKYKKLVASVRSHKSDRKYYDTSPHYADSTSPSPGSYDRKKGSVIDQLNRDIVRYQGQMDKWKKKVDFYDDSLNLGAVGGNLQTKRNNAHSEYISAQNRRDNARRQLNKLTNQPATIKDLSSPFYYSKDKNPWGSGTKPPSSKPSGSTSNNWSKINNNSNSFPTLKKKTIPAIEEQNKQKKPSSIFKEGWSDSKNTWDFNKYRNQNNEKKKNYKFRVEN